MKRRDFIRSSGLAAGAMVTIPKKNLIGKFNGKDTVSKGKILISGGETNDTFLKYFFSLTGKERPKVCLLPTASADRQDRIDTWMERGNELNFEPYAQKMFISSYSQKEDFASVLLSMDAIWVSGGNTLNMIAIWKAQGVDKILRQAWERGIVLGGGSAGSICWFEGGVTDSRPIELTSMEALGFLKGSHCPHYSSEGPRRGSYHSMLLDGRLEAGYALDNRVGILFEGTELKRAVSTDTSAKGYYVSVKNGKVVEEELDAEML